MVRGRGPRDTPGVYLSAIRGLLDLRPPTYGELRLKKTKRRSIYGQKVDEFGSRKYRQRRKKQEKKLKPDDDEAD